jgi:hypothetical protein
MTIAGMRKRWRAGVCLAVAIAAVAGVRARQQAPPGQQIDLGALQRNLLYDVMQLSKLDPDIDLIEQNEKETINKNKANLDAELSKRVLALPAEARELWPDRKDRIQTTYGHQPKRYQAHLRELRDRWIDLNLGANSQRPSCAPMRELVKNQLVDHTITRCTQAGVAAKRCAPEQPLAAPGSSRHELAPAEDVDLSRPTSGKVTLDDVARLAERYGLKRVFAHDVVHYEVDRRKQRADEAEHAPGPAVAELQSGDDELRTNTLTVITRGSARLQMIAPGGQRVGWGAANTPVINDLGARGYHPHVADATEVVDVGFPTTGNYRVMLTGTAASAYEVTFTHFTEYGRILGGGIRGGTIRPGEQVDAAIIAIPPTDGTPQALVVEPPKPLRLQATMAAGASPATSAALRRWRAQALATTACPSPA